LSHHLIPQLFDPLRPTPRSPQDRFELALSKVHVSRDYCEQITLGSRYEIPARQADECPLQIYQ